MNEFDSLELSTETIRELSAEEMGQVAGGVAQQSLLPTCACTGIYPTFDGCITGRICAG